LPIAVAACQTNSSANSVAGEIVGANVNVGHILRERRVFEVPANNWETKQVVIIGGGIAGLSVAWKFKKQNFDDFVLLELEDKIGGTSQSGTSPLVGYPWGAHYLPVPFAENEDLIELLGEMSLVDGRGESGEVLIKEQFLCREPEERIFYKGRWYGGLYLNTGAGREESRKQANQFQEMHIKSAILNQMTHLGMPESYKVRI
jgi:glycine/D-amino acid oxidase-like deaminating enzyme